jgi:hypothetical protein
VGHQPFQDEGGVAQRRHAREGGHPYAVKLKLNFGVADYGIIRWSVFALPMNARCSAICGVGPSATPQSDCPQQRTFVLCFVRDSNTNP